MTPKKIIIAVVILLLLIFVGYPYAKWKVKRWSNYQFDYRGQVEDTIKDMVEPSCLKPEYRN